MSSTKRKPILKSAAFLTTLLTFSFMYCQPPIYRSPCDTQSNFFRQLYLLKISQNSKTPLCGIQDSVVSRQSSSTTNASISGTISNLLSSNLVIQNNGGDDLSIPYGATSFSFPTKVVSYNVSIKTQPAQLTCSVANGIGIPSSNVTNVAITCSPKTLTFTGTVSTFASGLFQPHGTASDPSGTNLYIADSANHIIVKVVIATGATSTIAGSFGISGSIDGVGSAARFNNPQGIATDGTNVYIAGPVDNYVRKLELSTNTVTTMAGNPGGGVIGTPGFLDATGTASFLNQPRGLATDGTNVYVADSNNHRIRKIVIATNVVTTLAGNGTNASVDGIGTAAQFGQPQGITTDGTTLYVSDTVTNRVRKIIISSGLVNTLVSAGLNGPYGLVLDSSNIYIANSGTPCNILQYSFSSTTLSTLAGNGSCGAVINGSLLSARFIGPIHMTTDGSSIFVADYNNNVIRRIQ